MLNRCHSAYVHKNMIMQNHYSNHHCGHFGSIFTTHHHCGGGFGISGGFWGGLGAGVGLGVSNLLMSGINMLGGWLMGGFGGGFGNFGMGFGNWGGGFGNFGNFGFGNPGFWGLNGSTKASGNKPKDKTDNAASSKTETITVKEEVIKENADYTKIQDLDSKADGLIAKILKGEPVPKEELTNLINEIINYKKLDSIQDQEDNNYLDRIKTKLDYYKDYKPLTEDKNTIKVDSTNVKIDNLDLDAVKAWREFPETLSIEQARAILEQIGILDKDTHIATFNNNGNILKLLDKAEVIVEVAKNNNQQDAKIRGRIQNVQIASDGKISFNVDNSWTYGDFEYIYSFQQQEANGDTYKLTQIDKANSDVTGYQAGNWNTREFKVDTSDNLLNDNDNTPVVSHNKGTNYTEVQ